MGERQIVMPDPKAIFFDLDGTLLDGESGVDASWHDALASHCPGVGIEPAALFDAIDLKRRWFWADPDRALAGRMDIVWASRFVTREAMAHIGADLPALADTIADDYRALRDAGLKLFPRAIETLDAVRARGLRTALITNGGAKMQRDKVVRFDIERWIDCVVIEGEFGVGKPDERMFRHALASCDVRPDEAWMVGDNLEADIATPHRLGLHTVWVNAAADGPLAGAPVTPHRTIRHIGELLA